jgi:chlorophyll synthase
MARPATYLERSHDLPTPAAVLELLKPVSWFAPMWAFVCGIVSSGAPYDSRGVLVVGGLALAGPLVCGTSQAVNDWFDRDVDAVNDPGRPIPSGRVAGRIGLYVAILWTLLSATLAWQCGPWVFGASLAGLALAWAYSAPPLRLKRNGWLGNSAVALCYEGLPWLTGVALMTGHAPGGKSILIAALYSVGAHGIMTLHDFKSIAGDRRLGIRSLPAVYGEFNAAVMACFIMAMPQIAVITILFLWGHAIAAALLAVLWIAQLALMERLLEQPRRLAAWYGATGASLYVSGMLVAALALRAG